MRLILGREAYTRRRHAGRPQTGEIFHGLGRPRHAWSARARRQPTHRHTRRGRPSGHHRPQDVRRRPSRFARAHPKPHWREESEGTPLAGLLYCGRCGKIMYAQSLQRTGWPEVPELHLLDLPQGPRLRLLLRPAGGDPRDRGQGDPRTGVGQVHAGVREGSRPRDQASGRPGSACGRGAVRRQITAVDKKIDNATERLVSVHDSLVPAVEQKLLELRRERDAPRRQPDTHPTGRTDARRRKRSRPR